MRRLSVLCLTFALFFSVSLSGATEFQFVPQWKLVEQHAYENGEAEYLFRYENWLPDSGTFGLNAQVNFEAYRQGWIGWSGLGGTGQSYLFTAQTKEFENLWSIFDSYELVEVYVNEEENLVKIYKWKPTVEVAFVDFYKDRFPKQEDQDILIGHYYLIGIPFVYDYRGKLTPVIDQMGLEYEFPPGESPVFEQWAELRTIFKDFNWHVRVTDNYLLSILRPISETTLPAYFHQLPPTPPGTPYGYVLTNPSFENENLEFRVEREWLSKVGASADSISLVARENGRWIPVPTHLKDASTENLLYEADISGYHSLFAIVAEVPWYTRPLNLVLIAIAIIVVLGTLYWFRFRR